MKKFSIMLLPVLIICFVCVACGSKGFGQTKPIKSQESDAVIEQTRISNESERDSTASQEIDGIPFFGEEDLAKIRKESENNAIVSGSLSTAEMEATCQLCQSLLDFHPKMHHKTAEILAEYFCRCQRIELEAKEVEIESVRYEYDEQSKWEYWILTSTEHIEYWFSGFTVDGIFQIDCINRDGIDGEMLFGGYE